MRDGGHRDTEGMQDWLPGAWLPGGLDDQDLIMTFFWLNTSVRKTGQENGRKDEHRIKQSKLCKEMSQKLLDMAGENDN